MNVRLRPTFLALAFAASAIPAVAKTPADQLVVGMSMNNILTLDPGAITGRETTMVVNNIYDTLVRLDPLDKNRINPGIAEAWEIAPDGTITFDIRDDAVFASGNPVMIDDVIWSLHRDIKLGLAGAGIWKTYGFTAENIAETMRAQDGALVVTLPQPTDPNLVLAMFGKPDLASVVDMKTALEHEVNGDMASEWLKTNTAGSGPYKLDRWNAGDLLVLSQNPSYWGDAPAMKRVLIRHMPESQTKRLMLEQGDLDVALGLSVPDIAALANNPDVVVQAVPSAGFYYLAVNMKDERFQNRKVREALRHLIDYEGINETIMPNYGILHQWPIAPGLAATPENPGWSLDVAKARELLAEAGHPDGFEVELLALNESPFLDAATAIQSTLAQAGIKARIVTGTGNQVYGPMRERRFEMIVGRGGGGSEPHPHSNLRALVINPNNADDAGLSGVIGWRTAYQSEEQNRLANEALLAPDVETRDQLYRDLLTIWAEEVSALFPFSAVVDTSVMRADVKGYQNHYGFMTRFDTVTKDR